MFTDYREMLKEKDIEMVTIAAPNSLHAQMTRDCGGCRQTRRLRETFGHDHCRGRGDDRRCETTRSSVDVRRGTSVHAEIFEGERNGRCRRLRENLSGQSKAKNISARTANGSGTSNRSGGGAFMDLGCHGIAFCLLVHGPLPYQIDLLPDGHLRSRRQDSGRGRLAMYPRVCQWRRQR